MPSPMKPTTCAFALERLDDALLVGRGQPGKDAGGAGGFGQRRLAQRLDLRAEQDLFDRQAHFLADIGGDDLVIAGQDLDVHFQAVQPLQGLRGGLLGRVEEGEKTQQDQIGLILDRVNRLIGGAGHLLVGQGDHPEALTVQLVHHLPAVGVVFGLNIENLPVEFHPGAQAHDFIHRAFADQRVQPGFIFHDHRHPAPHEVKGDFVDLAIFLLRFQAFFQLLMVEDRFVEQVFQPGMVVAVQIAIVQHLLARIAVRVQVLFEHDLALGDGAGLVGAEHVHRSEVLDGVQAFDDHFLARHCQGALGQVDGHDHGQHLGGQPDCHRHGKQESLHPIVLGQPVDQKDGGHHHGNKTDHQPGELVDALVEAGELALSDDAGRQRAKVGAVSGVDDHGGRGAALHVGAEEAEVGQIERVLDVRWRRVGFAFHRQGFAGERRLVQEQVLGGEQPHVGRHHVTGGQVDDVARHQQLERYFRFHPAAHHRRRVADHRLELLGRVIGAHLLVETQHHAQHAP